ncbi:hypothetical protein NAEGRDRAFT_53403 [Naegleria gruberi]|uniref:F-box domain-containing protein n=1 Tax=Naegleria gruberi TaxID=5762 RepID=D2VZ36_NAEGR|nr:uncharacterized protein NAEGRDRAFT_53403 [Naegleria gruberi]EFC37922.1 hypothetical protein NAEGRDRAFT_53403 [Naegleria gruberi]|eukprot:XP_002670666.1 hypothetical protein NAEGRDRAFT_53403 [Naegleria gruberi strain NEG-M]
MDIVNIALLRKCVGSTNIIKTICDTTGKQFAIEMFLERPKQAERTKSITNSSATDPNITLANSYTKHEKHWNETFNKSIPFQFKVTFFPEQGKYYCPLRNSYFQLMPDCRISNAKRTYDGLLKKDNAISQNAEQLLSRLSQMIQINEQKTKSEADANVNALVIDKTVIDNLLDFEREQGFGKKRKTREKTTTLSNNTPINSEIMSLNAIEEEDEDIPRKKILRKKRKLFPQSIESLENKLPDQVEKVRKVLDHPKASVNQLESGDRALDDLICLISSQLNVASQLKRDNHQRLVDKLKDRPTEESNQKSKVEDKSDNSMPLINLSFDQNAQIPITTNNTNNGHNIWHDLLDSTDKIDSLEYDPRCDKRKRLQINCVVQEGNLVRPEVYEIDAPKSLSVITSTDDNDDKSGSGNHQGVKKRKIDSSEETIPSEWKKLKVYDKRNFVPIEIELLLNQKDVFFEIISWFDVESILTILRCVCKAWYDWIMVDFNGQWKTRYQKICNFEFSAVGQFQACQKSFLFNMFVLERAKKKHANFEPLVRSEYRIRDYELYAEPNYEKIKKIVEPRLFVLDIENDSNYIAKDSITNVKVTSMLNLGEYGFVKFHLDYSKMSPNHGDSSVEMSVTYEMVLNSFDWQNSDLLLETYREYSDPKVKRSDEQIAQIMSLIGLDRSAIRSFIMLVSLDVGYNYCSELYEYDCTISMAGSSDFEPKPTQQETPIIQPTLFNMPTLIHPFEMNQLAPFMSTQFVQSGVQQPYQVYPQPSVQQFQPLLQYPLQPLQDQHQIIQPAQPYQLFPQPMMHQFQQPFSLNKKEQ